jgi:hypothetical protein
MEQRAFERAHGDLRTDPLDVAHLVQVRFFHHASWRHVHAPAPLEPMDVFGQRPAIAGEADRIERRERIHEGDEIGRPERLEDELRQLLTSAERRHELADVMLVPEDQKHSHIVARRFRSGVFCRSDRQRQVVGRLARGFDELEGRNRLRLAVLQ